MTEQEADEVVEGDICLGLPSSSLAAQLECWLTLVFLGLVVLVG